MDTAEGEAVFRPPEACTPSRKDAGRSGKRWRKRSCALIEPRSPQSPRRAPPSPALLCFRGFLPRLSAVGGGIRLSSRATWPLLPMRDFAMAGGTGEARRFCGWKRAVRPRPFNLAVAMLCTVRKAERAVSLRPFRFDASCRRAFRRRTRLCAVRRLELKVQILYITKRKQNCNRFFFFLM